MAYDRNELITIGARFQPDRLLEWSAQIAQAARRDLKQIGEWGISDATLQSIKEAQDEIRKEVQNGSPHALRSIDAVVDEAFRRAFDWRQEVLGLSKAVFDSRPDLLAAFRPGVKISRSLPKAVEEISRLLTTLKSQEDSLQGSGGTQDIIHRGESALAALQGAESDLSAELAKASAETVALAEKLGILYTRTRFVARIGQTRFRAERERQKQYSYEGLRKQQEAKPKAGVLVGSK